jgi:photosystem II stability/assembly factor-like uncharacterized protein
VVVKGSPGQLYRTVDGGAHWRQLDLPVPSDGGITFEVITFSDPTNGWSLFQTSSLGRRALTLYATRDAGNTWKQLPSPPDDANGLIMRGPSEGWMGSGDISVPHVYTSNDAGQSWQRHNLSPPPGRSWNPRGYFPASVELLPGGGVVVIISAQSPGAEINVLTSFDRGATWRYIPAPPGEVAFQDTTNWWAMNGSFLFKSTDAGQTWTTVTDALPVGRYIPHVLDSRNAWALLSVEDGYGLAFTYDGGIHWTRTHVPKPD